jgi:hypothetical protein
LLLGSGLIDFIPKLELGNEPKNLSYSPDIPPDIPPVTPPVLFENSLENKTK